MKKVLLTLAVFLTSNICFAITYNGPVMVSEGTNWQYYPQINNSSNVVWQGSGNTIQYKPYDGSRIQLGNGRTPDINNNNHVAWVDGSGQIFYWDTVSATAIPGSLTSDAYHVQMNDAGQIVWQARGSSGYDGDIYYYNGLTVNRLTDNSTTDSRPVIDNAGHIVWGGDGVYYYDGNTITTLSTTYTESPRINSSGVVVWSEYDYSVYKSILYVWDGTSVQNLSDIIGLNYDASAPDISDNGYIVWQANNGIEVWDGSTVTRYMDAITENTLHLRINDYGDVTLNAYDAGWSREVFVLYNEDADRGGETPIPEPATIILSGCSVWFILRRIIRDKLAK